MTHHPRRGTARAAAVIVAAATLVGAPAAAMAAAPDRAPTRPASAEPGPPAGDGTPALTPRDGAFLEGTVRVAADATKAGDDVASLAVDDDLLPAEETPGVSWLSFDVGSNSTEARYHNYVLVNGEHRIDLPDAVDERVTLEVPNDQLQTGENLVEVFAGTVESSCGTNHDDFVLADVGLELLGEVADGEENELSYAFGDGSCGSNTSLLLHAELRFHIAGDPSAITGREAELDTTTLANGSHQLTATSASGKSVTHTVRVNNAPVGAPRITPVDGTLTSGEQAVVAALPAGAGGSVESLTVDGAEPPVPVRLAPGTATFGFDVGSNSIEPRYYNHLLVNGQRIDLGGEWAAQHVDIAVPNRHLVPGDNVVTVVTGDINGTVNGARCANRDDFALSGISLTLEQGTATGQDLAASYAMGDGTCGSSSTALPEAELHFTIDGAPTVRVEETTGAGDAVFSFDVGTNSIEDRYQTFLRVNGVRVPLVGDFVSQRVEVPIANELLRPGLNTVHLVDGTFPTSCGDNRDDYTISNPALAPAAGDATYVGPLNTLDPAVPIPIGDGNCGDSFTGVTEVAFTFDVDAPAAGLRADVDTAELADGEHTVAATTAGGPTATRALTTDNTAPVVAQSAPAAGQRITSAVALDLLVEDASGVVGTPEVTLDGQPVQEGDPVGPGLTAGEHTLAVTLRDSLGNTATRQVAFESAGIPDVPADLSPATGTTGVDGEVTLSARLGAPDGGDVTATFHQAEIVQPGTAFQGTSAGVPTTLAVAGEEQVDVSRLEPFDGAGVETDAGREVTFQRYDVAAPAGGEAPVLRWEGVIDPERVAALRVWDAGQQAWQVLASARGAVEGSTVLTAPVAERYVDGGVVHVMVTGEDPFADDLGTGDPEGFADPASYDFSIVHFTDTQYLSEGAVEQETPEERAVWAQAYQDVTSWITANAEEREIAYVAHTGDIIENNYYAPATPEMEAQVTGEFELSSQMQAILDDAGIPNQVIAGNHDNQLGQETGPDARYNDYYGPGRYRAADDQWQHAEYGGPWREGDNQNNYTLFSAGGLDFISVGLSYGVTRAEATWANEILDQYSDRNAILLSHDYLRPSNSPDGRGAGFSAPDGSLLYKKVVAANPNVFLVLAGHEHGVGTNLKTGVGATVGHDVVELLADYQFYTVSADRLGLTEIGGYAPEDQLRFGASFLRMLQFDVARGEMTVDTYSPFLDDFGATEFDTEQRYDGTEDAMVLPVDLTSRTTSFETDSVALYVPTEEIGTETVASGGTASVEWSDLPRGEARAWVVTATTPGGGVTTAEPAVFRTVGKAVPTVEVTAEPTRVGKKATVEVSVDGGEEPATGEVTVTEDGTVLGSATLVDGSARLKLPKTLAVGDHDLVASYGGNAHLQAAETSFTLTVADRAPSRVRVVRAPDAADDRFTVQVAVGPAAAAPTGRVAVRFRGEEVGAARLEDGRASVVVRGRFPRGQRTFVAAYLGSADVAPSSTRFEVRIR